MFIIIYYIILLFIYIIIYCQNSNTHLKGGPRDICLQEAQADSGQPPGQHTISWPLVITIIKIQRSFPRAWPITGQEAQAGLNL